MKINNINSTYQYTKTNNIKTKTQNNKTTPSFQGIVPQKAITGLSNFYEGVAQKRPFQNFAKAFSKTNNSFPHLMAIESCLLSGFYMINTIRNKKIDKEQKPQMLVNDLLTLGVSTGGAYLFESKVTKAFDKFTNNYFIKHKDYYIQQAADTIKTMKDEFASKVGEVAKEATDDGIESLMTELKEKTESILSDEKTKKAFQVTTEKLNEVTGKITETIKNNKGKSEDAIKAAADLADDIFKNIAGELEAKKLDGGMRKIKTLVVFGIIYRYLGPVVVTPIANKISAKIVGKSKNNKQVAQKA